MRMLLVGALAMMLVGATEGGCGGTEPAPAPYVCADPCPGAVATEVIAGELWCYPDADSLARGCGMRMPIPANPIQCDQTRAWWSSDLAHCR
jgi:hypothetical protein